MDGKEAPVPPREMSLCLLPDFIFSIKNHI